MEKDKFSEEVATSQAASESKDVEHSDIPNSPVSTASILSSINEECNKISCKESERTKVSTLPSDEHNKISPSNSNDLKEVSENGLSSLNSSNDENNTDSQDPVTPPCDDRIVNCNSSDVTSVASNKDVNEDKRLSEHEDEAISPSSNLGNENNESDLAPNTNKENSVMEVNDQEVSEVEMNSNQSSLTKEDSNSSTKELSQPVKDGESKDSLDSENGGTGKIKIKLRSLASLCEGDTLKEASNSVLHSSTNFEVTGVAVGDIVQHNNYVESDESGVMHLKISNVVGGEDCITGISMDDASDSLLPIQISSITSLIEPLSPVDLKGGKPPNNNQSNDIEISQIGSLSDKSYEGNKDLVLSNNDSSISAGEEIIVNIFRSPLIVARACVFCKSKEICQFRMVVREDSENRVSFICNSKCKASVLAKLPENHIVQKPRLYFEHICGMCGKNISNAPGTNSLSWQTREFCNKLCLADHIGEVARTCFYCKCNVRVLYMVKYCVRFGSDVHQFCCNSCLETFKSTIKVCSFCQKNLSLVNKVISPSNKEYCSNKCLKRAQRRDVGQINYTEENDCTVCSKTLVNKYEFLHNGATTFLCSTPCLNVFKYVNQVISVNCCLCARLLNAEEMSNYFFNGAQLRVFCSESCFSVFVISARKIVTCQYCKVKKYNFDMITSYLSEEFGEYYCCSVCCLNFVENQNKRAVAAIPATSDVMPAAVPSLTSPDETPAVINPPTLATVPASAPNSAPCIPVLKNCNMCSKLEPAQFHMVMSDSTLRSFCSYICATRYKCTFGFQVSGTVQTHEQAQREDLTSDLPPDQGKTSSSETQTAPAPISAPVTKVPTKLDFKDSKTIMRLFCPPQLTNKSTLCRPLTNTKGVQCKPHQWHKSCQTDDELRAIIPVPIPVYVPTPMMMYNAPTPVPLVIPVPVPIPVFIPTTEKTTEDLENRIRSLMKSELAPKKNPVDAGENVEIREENSLQQKSAKDDSTVPHQCGNETEMDVISKIEASLPKFPLGPAATGSSDSEKAEPGKHKRKLDEPLGSTSKRKKLDGGQEEETECLDLLMVLSVWQAWVQRRVSEGLEDQSSFLQEDLCNMSAEALNQSLILFLEDVSREVNLCEAHTLFYILLGLQKYLFEKGSTHCIFLEVNFSQFTTTFDGMVQKFFQFAAGPNMKCLSGTRVNEEMLWEARQLGAHTPHVLINTLFYFNTKIFKLKTPTEHFNLTFRHITKHGKQLPYNTDSAPVSMYLKYSVNADHDGGEESTTESPLMFENKDNPLRCPVKLYEFYLSKCPYLIREEKKAYYVYPERTCLPDSPAWYSEEPLEVETLEKMLNRILLVKEVQEALFRV